MAKRTLYPLHVQSDAESVRPILDALREKGFSVDASHTPKKNDTILFFLSENMQGDAPEIDEFLRLDAQKLDVIPVSLDSATPPALIESAIMARHTIFADRYTADELIDRIASAAKKPAAISSKMWKWIVGAAAVVLLAVVGLVLWRVLGSKKADETVAEATPAPTAQPTPVPYMPGDIPPEDIERIYELIFIGDRMYYTFGNEEWVAEMGWARVGAEYYATRGFEDDGAHWYSTEDGHRIETAHWEDLNFLRYMKNLSLLTFVCVEGNLPDLSGLENLGNVELFDSFFPDIEGLRGAGIMHFGCIGDPIDFSPLSDCPDLTMVEFNVNLSGPLDLSGFYPPKLSELRIINANQPASADLSAIGQCAEIFSLYLERVSVDDLKFLSNSTSLVRLFLHDMSLRTLDGVEHLKNLKVIDLMDVDDLQDVSAIKGCESLEVFSMRGYPENVTVRDLSALGKLPNLYYLSNVGAENTDLNFLKELPTKQNIVFSFVDSGVRDYTGLSAIESYVSVYMNMNHKDANEALSYLMQSSVESLYLREAINTDLSAIVKVSGDFSLETCDIRDFTSLGDDAAFSFLAVDDCRYLQSLDGIEKIKEFGTEAEGVARGGIYLEDCLHLTDFSAMEGLYFEECGLIGLNALPDFSTFSADTFYLEGFPELTDLKCFEGLNPDHSYTFLLSGLEGLKDISALSGLKGKHLCVRPELKDQAEALVESGVFESYEVEYPEAPWQPNNEPVSLLSLDELETLPKSVLNRVERFCMAGDSLFEDGEYRFETDWVDDLPVFYLCGQESEERIPIETGTELTDLSLLKDLTNLRELHLFLQPFETLDGIQYLESLERLCLNHCDALSDVSAAFTLQSIKILELNQDPGITSLEGIENLYKLEELRLSGLTVDDLSPLLSLPNLRLLQISKDMEDALKSLGENLSFEVQIID